ncbi:MAG: CBM35 domain-containing protein, partial [Roseiflexaceae bacterium]
KSSGCVFSKRDTAYGPGHNSFTKSPDNTEDWLVYHANTVSGSSWGGRSIRAQKFTWDGSGNPVFGTPAAIYDPIPLPSGETTSVGRYEAEQATINHATTRNACCGASNGQAVGGIDFADSYVQFNNVYVPKAGSYAISIRFGNGMGSNSTHNVTVNGGAQGSVTYPNTGWDNWTSVTKQVSLNAGNNTIRLSKGTQYAEVDYLELPRYEAEFATINNATITNNASASNGQKVGFIDFADSYVDFSVNVPSAGSYTMRVLHSTGAGASTHNVSVNGGASFAINYANNGWDNWTAVTASVSLTAGSNRIRFAKGTNYTELDYIEIYK